MSVWRMKIASGPLLLICCLLLSTAGLSTVRGRRLYQGEPCAKCNVPVAQGGCKCNDNCDCISYEDTCAKCNLPEDQGGCKCDDNCDCIDNGEGPEEGQDPPAEGQDPPAEGQDPPADTPQNPSGNAGSLEVFLNQHNEYRAKHGVPPLQWDDSLASDAQSYADSCPWGHGDSASRNGAGENLWWGGGFTLEVAMSSATPGWYGEVSKYDFGNQGFSSETGHFTQVVWKGTEHLGCGVKTGCDWATAIVCRYAPAGNVEGQYEANVFPAQG